MVQSNPGTGGWAVSYKLVGALLLAALVAVFTVQNVEAVEIRFLLRTVSLSRSLPILLSLAVGTGIGLFLGSWGRHRRRRPGP